MARTVWRHFVLVLALLALYDLLWMILIGHYRLQDIRQGASMWLLGNLPMAAAISLALVEFRRGTVRTALSVVGVALAVMVLLDIWAIPAQARTEAEAYHQAHPGPAGALVLRDTAGVLQRTVAFARGQVTVHDVDPAWQPRDSVPGPPGLFAPVRDPARLVHFEAVNTTIAFTRFLLPLILPGLVLGVSAWLTGHATFSRPRDSRILRVAAAWIVVFFVTEYLRNVQDVQRLSATRSGAIGLLFLPLLPAAALAALGWVMAARFARAAEP